jgi:hypothetical protein
MIIEIREELVRTEVYWVEDAQGVRHLFHDRLAAQLMEERWRRERNEEENKNKV